jgi:hypothetical protein
MEESPQVDRGASVRIPPFEAKALEGWGIVPPRAFFEAPPELRRPIRLICQPWDAGRPLNFGFAGRFRNNLQGFENKKGGGGGIN